MAEVPVKNDGKHDMHLGGKLIPPGEIRFVEQRFVHMKGKKESDPPPPNPLSKMLEHTVPQIAELIGQRNTDGQPVINNETLDELEQLEKAGKNRQGVLTGIVEERLSRADEAQEIEKFIAELKDMADEDLKAALELYKEDEGKQVLVEAELMARAQP